MTTTRLRLVALIAGIAALVLSVAPGTASARRQAVLTAQVAAPVFSFPSNGASYPANGPYLFQVQPVSGAKGYLWSFVQNGMIVYQNLAWDGRLSSASYTISTHSQAHKLIHVGGLHVWVRALMKNGHWSGTGEVMVRIQGRGGPRPKPTATSRPKATATPQPTATPQATATPGPPAAGTVLYQADTSGGLDKVIGGPGWKHLNGQLITDASVWGGSVTIPYDLHNVVNYAVDVQLQYISGCNDGYGNAVGTQFSLLVRQTPSGYYRMMMGGCSHIALDNGCCQELTSAADAFDTNWHDYRLEVQGNTIRLLVDGSPLLSATDNGLVTDQGGRVGFLNGGQFNPGIQCAIRSITITAL